MAVWDHRLKPVAEKDAGSKPARRHGGVLINVVTKKTGSGLPAAFLRAGKKDVGEFGLRLWL